MKSKNILSGETRIINGEKIKILPYVEPNYKQRPGRKRAKNFYKKLNRYK